MSLHSRTFLPDEPYIFAVFFLKHIEDTKYIHLGELIRLSYAMSHSLRLVFCC